MGLLDGTAQPSLLDLLALNLLQGQSPNFGQNVGNAGLQSMFQYNQLQDQNERRKLGQMQIENSGLDLEAKKRAIADDAKAREVAARIMAQRTHQPMYGGDMPAGTEMPSTPAYQAPQASQAPGVPGGGKAATAALYEQYANEYERNGLFAQAEKYRQLAEKYRPEIREVKTMQMGGKRVNVAIYKDGTSEVMPYSPDAEKAHFADVGNGIIPVDPFTGKPLGTVLDKSVTPGEQLSAATTRRGQDMTDARAREVAADARANKPLTESQAKGALYLGMMNDAEAAISKIQGFDPKTGKAQVALSLARGDVPKVPGAVQNLVAGKEAQQYNQATLQWSEAMLRQLTGANAPEQEVVRNARTYFPMPGDTSAVIAQKNAARKNMTDYIRLIAGKGADEVDAARAARPPSIDDLVRKYAK